jgi:hypothetical protein
MRPHSPSFLIRRPTSLDGFAASVDPCSPPAPPHHPSLSLPTRHHRSHPAHAPLSPSLPHRPAPAPAPPHAPPSATVEARRATESRRDSRVLVLQGGRKKIRPVGYIWTVYSSSGGPKFESWEALNTCEYYIDSPYIEAYCYSSKWTNI